MESETLVAIRTQNDARMTEEKRILDRRRNIMVLINQHCLSNGYFETAEKLQQEAGIALSKFETCDNIDLFNIVCEFETYYEMRFGKKPKMTRKKADGSSESSVSNAPKRRSRPKPVKSSSAPAGAARIESSSGQASERGASSREEKTKASEGATNLDGMGVSGTKSGIVQNGDKKQSTAPTQGPNGRPKGGGGFVGAGSYDIASAAQGGDNYEPPELRLLKPLPLYHSGDNELRQLATVITREIFQESPNVRWEDVVGLDDAKRLLKEAVVMPLRYPQLFTGLLSPWGGVLLYGPPGTGKTMLAKAVATECKTTFFNISASSIVSKYRGDSEKLVRVLFELARFHAPSTIFLDEIDSIMGQRGGFEGNSEHEGSRRMKTELLIQMDGLSRQNVVHEYGSAEDGEDPSAQNNQRRHVFVLAASNLPWELDLAMLRRLEKRVMVPLPNQEARLAMLQKHLFPPRLKADVDLESIAQRTEGFSGSDIKLLCKESAMRPVRRLLSRLEALELAQNNQNSLPEHKKRIMRHEAKQNKVSDERVQEEILADPISTEDVETALSNTKPSAALYQEKYDKWQREFGAV